MVEVSLYSSHLPPSGARFPSRCVVCGGSVETSAERPVEVGSQTGALQAFFQRVGPQQRVPVHLDACLKQLRREHFREHAVPLLHFLMWAGTSLLIAWIAGMSAVAATLLLVAVSAVSLPLIAWMHHGKVRGFAIRQEMDENFRGLVTYCFRDTSAAREFEALNETAIYKVKSLS